jgi:hypothetical protein
MPEPEQLIDARSVFLEPAYVRFWSARICSTISFQVTAVAVGWQVYALTQSTFALGMVGLVQFLPMLLNPGCDGLIHGHSGESNGGEILLFFLASLTLTCKSKETTCASHRRVR